MFTILNNGLNFKNMQKNIYKEDCKTNFGKWNYQVSKFMYFDSIKEILSKINIPNKVADYGGANGILKQFIPNIITIDIDESKKPDIVDNILTHKGTYDLIIIRYVLHYLNDYQVLQLFKNIKQYHKGSILVIQFCNNDLKSKYYNSKNEFKYFRTENQLEKLLPKSKKIYSKKYMVTNDFYRNRLQIKNTIEHEEILNAYYYKNLFQKELGEQE